MTVFRQCGIYIYIHTFFVDTYRYFNANAYPYETSFFGEDLFEKIVG